MATRRNKKVKEPETLPPQVPLSIDTFAAIVDAGRGMSNCVKYIKDPAMQMETAFIGNAILEHGQMGMKDIEIARDPERISEKSKSRALVPLPFFMAMSFGFRLFKNYLETHDLEMPEKEKTSAISLMTNALNEFEKARLEGIQDHTKIEEMMKQLMDQLQEAGEDIPPIIPQKPTLN